MFKWKSLLITMITGLLLTSNPASARFYSVDPVGFQESNSISFNRYGYANNNPYGFTDPNGESPFGFLPQDYFSSGQVVKDMANRDVAMGAMAAATVMTAGLAPEIVIGVDIGLMVATGEPGSLGGSKSLNLGSGSNPMRGAVNVDLSTMKGVNIQATAGKLPFKTNTFTEVNSINPYGFNPVSAETARVMQSGGVLKVTGTKNNPWARVVDKETARKAGFKHKSTTSIDDGHQFGTQRSSNGKELNTSGSETSSYEKF